MSPRHPRRQTTTGVAENEDDQKLRTSLLDNEDADYNIPLRILLLLMDEVFDLKTRSQWLRRRIITLLKEIVKATFGDRINKKIVQKVESLTSAEHIADYVRDLKDSMWPDGIWRTDYLERDAGTQIRTRIAAKAKMLGTVPDDLKRFIGADTTREGVCRVFDMFQHPRLNKRLLYVVLENLLVTVFPDNKFPSVFDRLHGAR